MATLCAAEGNVDVGNVIGINLVFMSGRAIAGARRKWMTIERRAVKIFSRLRVDQVPLGGHVSNLSWIVNLQDRVIGIPAVVEA